MKPIDPHLPIKGGKTGFKILEKAWERKKQET